MGIHMPCVRFAVHRAIDAIGLRMGGRLDSANQMEVTFGISRLAVRNGRSEISTQMSVSLAKLQCAMSALLKELHNHWSVPFQRVSITRSLTLSSYAISLRRSAFVVKVSLPPLFRYGGILNDNERLPPEAFRSNFPEARFVHDQRLSPCRWS